MSTRWLTRNSRALAIVVLAAAMVVWFLRARRTPPHEPSQTTQPPISTASAGGYADAASCATCHAEIARTYSATGMARGFATVGPDVLAGLKSCATGTCSPAFVSVASGSVASGSVASVSVAQDFSPALYHKPSNRHYAMVERDGRLFQRRHQAGFGGRETNMLELEAHYVIGSGNHARTFLHRTASGRLLQLPVSWYAGEGQGAKGEGQGPRGKGQGERGKGQGYWEMSPGYDRPAHLDFRRAIDAGCVSCHTGYPRAPVEDDPEGPQFGDSLPEGIDCQRCHGPGQRHIEAIGRGDVEAGRRAIVNPAALNRERQLETCLQCHLESTSSALPFQIRRHEHAAFSYVPGQPLADYFLHFDHAPGSNRDDKFEINSAGYRLRQSACFQKSEMTCVTCHDPHEAARGPAVATRYAAICESCHTTPHPPGVPRVAGVRAGATCLDCHMPKRRAEDAVHVVMTDHFIQRTRPSRNLIAARTEAQSPPPYRGEVVAHYPSAAPTSAEGELYLAVAQVQDGSNLTAGLQQLQRAIERHRPSRPDFYYQLARAYSTAGDAQAAIRWCREALQRDAGFVPALKELAAAAMTLNQFGDAAEALERVVARRPEDANALADLGNAYLRQDRIDQGQRALERALALDASNPRAHNLMGLAKLRTQSAAEAEARFRDAIRLQPDLAEAHNNLGNLLASRRAYDEAGFHFAEAIGSNPDYVEAHHSYGVVLALTKAYAHAAAELKIAIRLAPDLDSAHLDLAEVLVTLKRRDEARAHFEAAARSADPGVRAAALAALQAR